MIYHWSGSSKNFKLKLNSYLIKISEKQNHSKNCVCISCKVEPNPIINNCAKELKSHGELKLSDQ